MFEILDMVHGILEEQKITAEEQLQLNKICDMEDKFVKVFSKDKWKEYNSDENISADEIAENMTMLGI